MTSKLVFRNPDKVQQLPFRDYIRERCPGPGDGLVVTDLDLIVNQFGSLVGRHKDADGRIYLVELKNSGTGLNYAQSRTMQLMHKLMRIADPAHKFYGGCYLLHWDYERNIPTRINNVSVTEQQFLDWITGKYEVASLFDEKAAA